MAVKDATVTMRTLAPLGFTESWIALVTGVGAVIALDRLLRLSSPFRACLLQDQRSEYIHVPILSCLARSAVRLLVSLPR